MGTTLALSGAYNLAGALTRHPADLATAFAEYEADMRPLVARAQKLAPGIFTMLHPETQWGIWLSLAFQSFLVWSGIVKFLFKYLGHPAEVVLVKDYGFKDLPELTG